MRRAYNLDRKTAGFVRDIAMTQPSKRAAEGSEALPVSLSRLAEQTQLDFELDFFSGVLSRHGEYIDVLRAHGNNLTLKGRYADGLELDKRLIQLRPHDALAHYNLACSYALLKKPDLSLKPLRRAVELGYRDFRYLREDRDPVSVRP